MSDRIGSLASSQMLNRFLMTIQKRMETTQVQINSEKVSQTYSGLAATAERLVNMENQTAILNQYNSNNDLMDVDLQFSETTLEGIQRGISDFREQIIKFQSGDMANQTRVGIVQDAALSALLSIETYLNTDVGGKFIFAGSRTDTIPVDLGLTNLADFQTKWTGDVTVGAGTTYPVTYNNDVLLKLTTTTGHPTDTATPTTTGFTNLTFTDNNPAADSITATNAGAFANLPVGSQITIGGADLAGNDGTYIITAKAGDVLTVTSTTGGDAGLITDGVNAGVTLIADTSYYKGDTNTTSHKVTKGREFTYDINALDPAFEKAIRAMSLIAQGAFGTAGGLDQVANQTRVDDASYLLSSAFDPTSTGTPPYGAESRSNISDLSSDNSYYRVLVNQYSARNLNMVGFLEQRTADVENINSLDAITRFLDDQMALEASYQAMARVRSLSLNNFL